MAFRWYVHLALFLLTFAIEVRVQAAESIRLPLVSFQKLVQQPRGCLNQPTESCALATFVHQKFLLKFANANVWMDENTSIVRVASRDLTGPEKLEIRIIKGQIWVSTNEAFRVSGDNGAVTAKTMVANLLEPADDGLSDFWVKVRDNQMVVSSVTEPVILMPRGSVESLLLPAGLENFLARADEKGVAGSGIPMPIAFSEHLSRWARLFSGRRKPFETAVEKFHTRWVKATLLSAEINQAQVEQRLGTLKGQALLNEKQTEKQQTLASHRSPANADSALNGIASGAKRELSLVERRKVLNQRVNQLFRKKFFSGE